MLNEEPAQNQNLRVMGMLLPLGIEKGKDFKPDVATVARLNSAAAEAHAKDYEFSRRSMEDHRRARYYDAVRTLRHPEVLEQPRQPGRRL